MRQRGQRFRALVVLVGTSALAAALFVGCARDASVPSPAGEAIVLVTIDTLRADRVGSGGDPHARTPYLDRFARSGTQWCTALAATPLTLPSHATILSGVSPPEHGARDNGTFRVEDDVPLVSELLAEAGWTTAAFLAAYPLAARFGLARGFDVYQDAPGLRQTGSASSFAERPAHLVVNEALAWLEAERPDRLFLWIHLFDPHAPYEAPRPWPRILRDRYAAEVAFTDRQIGRLERGIEAGFASTSWLLTADHGESLGQHGEETHGVFVYEATTRVPLVSRRTGAPGGRLHREPVSTAAAAATLAGWGGTTLDAAPPLPDEPPSAGGAPLYLESMYPRLRHGWSPLRAWRDGDVKVIRAPRPEVYDLATDPGELTNLADSADERALALLRELAAPRFATPSGVGVPDPEVEETLAALGYASVSRAADPARADDELPDPKDRVRLEAVLGRVASAVEAGDFARAHQGIAAAFSIDPANKETHVLLARLEARSGNVPRARELFARCLELPPAALDPLVHYEAGRVELDLGRPEAAEAHFGAAVAGDPLHADAVYNWGLAAYRAGRFGDAADRWERALRIAPEHPLATEWLPDARARAKGEKR